MIERSRRYPRRPPAQPKESIRKTLEEELQFAQQKVAELQEQEQSMRKQSKIVSKPKKPVLKLEEDDDLNDVVPLQDKNKRPKARRKSIVEEHPPPRKFVPKKASPIRTAEFVPKPLHDEILENLKREINKEQNDVRKMMNELITQLKNRKYRRLENEMSLKATSEFIYS